jgi:hypothetical protein
MWRNVSTSIIQTQTCLLSSELTSKMEIENINFEFNKANSPGSPK